MTRNTVLRVLIGIALMAVACSSAPDANTRYESVFDIREAVEDGGYECSEWRVRGTNEYARESAECTSDTVFAIFDSASAIVDQREVRNALLSIIQDTAYDLTGPSWNVGCPDLEQCERLQALLGGDINEWDLTELAG